MIYGSYLSYRIYNRNYVMLFDFPVEQKQKRKFTFLNEPFSAYKKYIANVMKPR